MKPTNLHNDIKKLGKTSDEFIPFIDYLYLTAAQRIMYNESLDFEINLENFIFKLNLEYLIL